jgi:hypothetical protein
VSRNTLEWIAHSVRWHAGVSIEVF